MMFPTNYWYAAAWSGEVGHRPLARTILNRDVVLFRGNDGIVGALEDRCAHRGLPLSMGDLVEGNHLRCRYHGLQFNRDGHCVAVPGQANIPASACVKSFPVIERWNLIWIWMGAVEGADPDLVPDLHWLSDPEWRAVTGQFRINSNYLLLMENLHDHTHLQFVHARTIGTDNIVEAEVDIQRSGDTVKTTRWLIDRPAPPLFAKAGRFSGNVDRWFNSEFTPPSNVVLDIGCAAHGTGATQGRREGGISIRSIHAVTPEADDSLHYFWAYVRNFGLDDEILSNLLGEGAKATFEEDVEVLEAQQKNLERHPNAAMIDVNNDAAPLLVRNIIQRIVKREANASSRVSESAQPAYASAE